MPSRLRALKQSMSLAKKLCIGESRALPDRSGVVCRARQGDGGGAVQLRRGRLARVEDVVPQPQPLRFLRQSSGRIRSTPIVVKAISKSSLEKQELLWRTIIDRTALKRLLYDFSLFFCDGTTTCPRSLKLNHGVFDFTVS